MQVGISQLIAGDLPLATFFEQSAQAGYEVVELCLRRQGELTPETSPEQLAQIVAAAKAQHLALVSLTHSHCTGNLLDSGEKQQKAIQEGREYGTVTQNPYGLGYAAIVAAVRAIQGLPVDQKIDTGYQWLDKDTIDLETNQKYLYN